MFISDPSKSNMENLKIVEDSLIMNERFKINEIKGYLARRREADLLPSTY